MQGVIGNIELSKPIGQVLLSACTYNTSLAMPAFLTEQPASDEDTGIACVNTQKRAAVTFMFAGTDDENETLTYQLIGLIPVRRRGFGEGWVPFKIAEGTITLGDTALGSAGKFVETSASRVADTITQTSMCGLSRVFSPAGDESAYLVVDCSQFQYVYVQVKRGTCATIDVIAIPGDMVGLGADDALLATVSPPIDAPQAALTCVSGAWNDLAIPAGTARVQFWCGEDVHVVLSGVVGDPAQLGCVYSGGITFDLPCRGHTYLHYKNRDSSSDLYATFKKA